MARRLGFDPYFRNITPQQAHDLRVRARQQQRSFTPYKPPGPPAGSYDPALDATRAAAHRGYVDLTQDVGLQGTRAATDYGIQLNQENQNYDTNTGLLRRAFAQVANRQLEGANQAGVISGGAMLQAAAKRAANEGIQQSALDVAHRRTTDALGLDYERGLADRTTQLTRAGREDRRFGVDTNAEKAYQAAQAGYVPPGRGEPGGVPKNEFRDANGAYRIATVNGQQVKVRPDGTYEPVKKKGFGARRSGARFGGGAASVYGSNFASGRGGI